MTNASFPLYPHRHLLGIKGLSPLDIETLLDRADSADRTAILEALEKTEYTSLTGRTVAFDENNQAHNAAIIMRVDGTDVVIEAQSDT